MMSYVSDAPLGDEEVATFDRDGFVRLTGFADVAEIASLRSTFDLIFGGDVEIAAADRVALVRQDAGAGSLSQVLNPDAYAPELRETRAYRTALAVARQLLGSDATHMGMHAILKPPGGGAETPWHQDEAYWDPQWDHRAVSVWVPLQPATVDNGCMHFVPGSHRLEVLDHRLAHTSAEALVLSEGAADVVVGPVACPVPEGGATVHANRTVHYAGPNRTDEPRRALVFAFRTPATRRSEARAFPWQPDRWYEQPTA
jgi:ectoine hydroxylase-related dioxygenase (phytanoyl-CoA dioxygenase family)